MFCPLYRTFPLFRDVGNVTGLLSKGIPYFGVFWGYGKPLSARNDSEYAGGFCFENPLMPNELAYKMEKISCMMVQEILRRENNFSESSWQGEFVQETVCIRGLDGFAAIAHIQFLVNVVGMYLDSQR